MAIKTTVRLTAAVEHYFADLQRVRASGSATGERSCSLPQANLLYRPEGETTPSRRHPG